jgi:hypothetical protein
VVIALLVLLGGLYVAVAVVAEYVGQAVRNTVGRPVYVRVDPPEARALHVLSRALGAEVGGAGAAGGARAAGVGASDRTGPTGAGAWDPTGPTKGPAEPGAAGSPGPPGSPR